MNQRRLLCLTPEPWPTFRADIATLLGRELPRCGVSVDLVTACDSTVPWQEWGGGEALLCRAGQGRYMKHLSRMAHVLRSLFRATRDRYDAIQVRDMPVVATLALIFGSMRGLPVVYWMSYPVSRGLVLLALQRRREGSVLGWLPTWLRGTVGEWLLDRLVLRRSAFVVVQSERMRDELAARGIPVDRLLPVPMGVDIRSVDEVLREPIAAVNEPERPIVGYLGTLDRPRRIDVLLDMAALVRREMPDLLLLLVGDTRDIVHRQRLVQQIGDLGLDGHVLITGWLPMNEAWRRMRSAAVAVSPIPRGELLDCSSPTKVPEYLCMRIPVVGNDNPDQKSVIAASGAGSCVHLTAEAFADAVLRWLRLPREERLELAESGRAYVLAHRDYARLASALADEFRLRLTARGER